MRAGDPVGPGFDIDVPRSGYAWWYVDAQSEDRRHGLTIIGFIGSVFSPYYAWSKAQNPLDHVSMNVALYGEQRGWAMTERGASSLSRDADTLVIGPSAMHWEGDSLRIEINETTCPIPSKLQGTVRLDCPRPMTHRFALDADGRHIWRPIAVRARVEVEMTRPALRWRGEGYLDHNAGPEPLADGFIDWHWLRAHRRQDSMVFYEGRRRDGSDFALNLRFGEDGSVEEIAPPPDCALPKTLWRMPRRVRCDAEQRPVIRGTWEDTPFYSRTALSTRLFGQAADAVHESLSLDRLKQPIVQAMLPFRMPRVFR